MKARCIGRMPVIMMLLWSACCIAIASTMASTIISPAAAQERAVTGAADILPPAIEHEPLTHFPDGMPLRIQARVTDDSGVGDVILFYRPAGTTQYRQMPMLRASGSHFYAADLPAGLGPRIEYFIRASDTVGNSVLGNLFDPYLITVTESAVAAETAAMAQPASPPVPPSSAFDTAAGKRGKHDARRWIWVGVGVLAVAALAGAGGGGGGSGAPPPSAPGSGDTGSVTINAPLPP